MKPNANDPDWIVELKGRSAKMIVGEVEPTVDDVCSLLTKYDQMYKEVEWLQKVLAEELPCELCAKPVTKQVGYPVCWACYCEETNRLRRKLDEALKRTEAAPLNGDPQDRRKKLAGTRAIEAVEMIERDDNG